MASTTLSPPSTSDGVLGVITSTPSAPLEDSKEKPSSPAAPSSTQLEFLTNLLHEVLSSNALACPLPADFSAALLRDDDGGPNSEACNVDISVLEGVPSYPLYKHLARALNEWILTGAFPRTMEPMPGITENEEQKMKIDNWSPKVLELGSSLLELGQRVGFLLHVQEPYFSQLKAGTKTVEGRCASGAYNKIGAGDSLLFNQSLLLKVEDVKRYSTFQQMLEVEGLSVVLPGVASIDEGVQVYRAFYSEAREQAGVLGIHVCCPSDLRQPFELLYDLLNEINVEGVRALLGMRTTMGSIEDALPPPTSALLSSFLSLQHEVIPGSKLTVGARALAKHVHRSSDGWWGVFTGTEPAKNDLAFKIIRKMMEQAIWLNVHIVPVPVFEVRVRDGYGARWLADGSQFRGFLEPPMEEGYMNKWRH
ncbi:unnamed protein product [Calypogeia fissa]